jgi:hypothetical protein
MITSDVRVGSKGEILAASTCFPLCPQQPEVVKRVSIVTSSLSKKAVENAFADIKNGKRPTAHFVQLYWLLTSFFSACAEVGAAGYVICQP